MQCVLIFEQAGLNDYDDLAMQKWTYTHPNQDYTPFDFLATVNKTLVCSPGKCGYYSSIGWVMEVVGHKFVRSPASPSHD